MTGERDRDAAGAGADIDDEKLAAAPRQVDHPLDQKLGLRPGDQDVGGDEKLEAVKFLAARDVLQGLARRAPLDQAKKDLPVRCSQLVIRTNQQLRAIDAQHMAEQDAGGKTFITHPCVAQHLCGFGDGLSQCRHGEVGVMSDE